MKLHVISLHVIVHVIILHVNLRVIKVGVVNHLVMQTIFVL